MSNELEENKKLKKVSCTKKEQSSKEILEQMISLGANMTVRFRQYQRKAVVRG